MKKLFVGILAIAGLVACAQEEVLRTQAPGQIGFDGAYVENAVRAAEDPSTTTDNLTAFDVWGYMTETAGVVFDRETVSGGAGNWSYTNTQYWVPGHNYRFFALAPAGTQNVQYALGDAYNDGLGEITFTNIDGTEDLLYASKEDVAAPAQGATTADKVTFAFDHILSKIKFAFTNGIENENAYIVVKGIRLEVPAQGTIELNKQGAYTWANQAGATTLEFGHMDKGAKIQGLTKGECDYERLTIPAGPAQEYKVTFNVEFYMGDVLATSTAKSAVITGVTFEPGKAYKLTATLNKDNVAEETLLPIEFDVEKVNEWVDGGVYDGDDANIKFEDLNPLATTTVAASQTLTLTEDVQTTTRVVVEENAVLDGANHLLAATGVDGAWVIANTLRFVEVAGGSTVKNLTIDGNNLSHDGYGIRGLYTVGTGDVTIENVTVRNSTYGINANNAGKLIVKNSTLQSWNSFGSTTVNEFENVTFIAGSYANVRPYNNTVFTNCEFTDVQLDLSELIADAKVTFVNCTYNGVAITVDNVAGLNWDSYEAARVVVASTQKAIVVAAGETYDGHGATVEVEANREKNQNGVILPATGGATIQNVTVDGGNGETVTGQGYRGIYLNGVEGTYTIKDVTIKNCTYSINVNTTKDVVLNVSESYLQGWLSYGATTTATFTNVTFAPGVYVNFRPYGDTVLTNCEFEAGMVLDMKYLGCTDANAMTYRAATIKFVNCTVDGQPLAATHLQDVPATATVVIE